MNDAIKRPRQIWLRSFYGFTPEEAGYIGWSEEGNRDRMLRLIEDGDLFMIYGAASSETAKSQRNKILGFLQVRAVSVRDTEKTSPAGLREKISRGWENKWTFGISVSRAWRVDELVLLEVVAPLTYRPEKGRAIAVWNPPLLPQEIDLALKLKVTEVQVYGEPPIAAAALKNERFVEAFRPSRAFPGSFGERKATYKDGPTFLYLARFEGNAAALLGEASSITINSGVFKIGVSNDPARRLLELNSGFPPAGVGKWKMPLVSEAYNGREAAEAAEQMFKDRAERELRSLGREFFIGKVTTAQSIFATIPGVARFSTRTN